MANFIIILTTLLAITTAIILNVQSSLDGSASSKSTIGSESVRSGFTNLRDLYLEARDNPTAICGGGTDFNSCPQLYSVYVPNSDTEGYIDGSGVPPAVFTGQPVCQDAAGNQSPQLPGGGCPVGSTITVPPTQSYPDTYGEEVPTDAQAKPVCRYIAQCESQENYNGFTEPGLAFPSSVIGTKPEYCKLRVTYTRMLEGECASDINSAPTQTEICAQAANTTTPARTSSIVDGPNPPQYKFCATEFNVYQVERRQRTGTVPILGTPTFGPYNVLATNPTEFNNLGLCTSYLTDNALGTGTPAVGGFQHRCVVSGQRCSAYTANWTATPKTNTAPICQARSSLLGGILPIVDGVTGLIQDIVAGTADPSELDIPNLPNPNAPGSYQAINYLDPNKLIQRVQNSLAGAGELPKPIGFDWVRDEVTGDIKYIVPITDTSIDVQGFRDVFICLKANPANSDQPVDGAVSMKSLLDGLNQINLGHETMDENCNIPGECKAKLLLKATDGNCDPEARAWMPSDGVENAALMWNLGQILPKRECTDGTTFKPTEPDNTCPATHPTRIDWKTRVNP